MINDVREEKPLGEREELSAVRKSLQAALDDYPKKGGKIDYEHVNGVRKAPGTKKKKPKKEIASSHTSSLFAFFLCSLVIHSSGADYYVDSVDGSDGNDGLSMLTPWKSHKKAESASLAAGDVIHFKRGSAFSGSIRISESGTAAKPIRLTSYGKGDLPKFTNPTTRDASGNAIILGGDYVIVENLHFHDTPGEHVSGMIIMTRLPLHCVSSAERIIALSETMNSSRRARASCRPASIP